MPLNKLMHPRNIYKNSLDFRELGVSYPELLDFMIKKKGDKVDFDFKNREGLRCLTTCLLKKDFNIEIRIPENTLVPTLPLRLNYILWIEDLQNCNQESKIKGIDIGTGATCIYPLLISRKNSWKMIGTDISDDIIQIARDNVINNHLEDFITVVKMSSLRDLLCSNNEEFDFCMCNPPFFKIEESDNELPKKQNRLIRKERAKTQVSGTWNEISSSGGEVEFIKKIIQDSLLFKTRIKIYTTMIGCKSSLRPVFEFLKANSVETFIETTFNQGRTTRWAIAWTFSAVPLKSISQSKFEKKQSFKPFTQVILSKYEFKNCIDKIEQLLEQMKLEFQKLKQDHIEARWHFKAYQNTWTGLRRKRREEKLKKTSTVTCKSDDKKHHEENETFFNSLKRRAEPELNETEKFQTEEELSRDCIFEAELTIINLQDETEDTKSKISLQMNYLDGQRDAPGQMFYFFKNNLT